MHYKKRALVLIIRNILTENMYHDHNYLTICIWQFDCRIHLTDCRIHLTANELMNTARRGDWGVRRVVWRIGQHSVVYHPQFSQARYGVNPSPAD